MRALTTVQRLTSATLFSILLLLAAFTTGCDSHGPAFGPDGIADAEAPASSRMGDDGRSSDDGFVDPKDATVFFATDISETSSPDQQGPDSINPSSSPDSARSKATPV